MVSVSFLAKLGLGRPEQRAWAMYDWANSAYATVVMAAVLPPFFATYYARGMEPSRATTLYALLTSVTLLITAMLSPLAGIMADRRGAKKRMLTMCVLLGSVAVACLFGVAAGNWPVAAGLVAVAATAFGLSLVFYDGLLLSVAGSDEVDRVSAAGYALGYAGGGLLLALNTAWILWPTAFGMADESVAIRWSLLSVGVWWTLFTVPLLRKVPEPPAEDDTSGRGLFVFAARRLWTTFREIRSYRDLFLFLLAFWTYNDGIGTIIKMAAIFGSEIGIETHHLVLALLITQFVAFPCSMLFGSLAAHVGPRNGIYIALAVYAVIAVLGYFMHHTWQFYALATMVGTVQGGAQALSRSLFSRMVPRHRAGEFFGFFSVSSKFATILGPLVFAVVSYTAGNSRLAVLSTVLFFLGGIVLLRYVDIERGESRARAEEQKESEK